MTTKLMIASILLVTSCTHESDGIAVDAELLERARTNEAAVWYKFNDTLLPRSSGSGHSQALLRTRFNAKAATVLDSLGKVLPDTLFPEGSLIVKELWDDANSLNRYAMLLKRSSDPAADPDGWVWGYILSNGTVATSAADQGVACRTCHGQSGQIDRTLMNHYFP